MKTPPSSEARTRPSRASASQQTTDRHASSALALQLQSSPRLSVQRRAIDAAFGATTQRAGPEEEPLQGRFANTVQREGVLEEDMPAQSKQAPLQQAQQGTAAPPNKTGMPDTLKSGIEALSGMDLSDVRVHRNSSQPAQLNALAYAQGNDVHLGPGQEQHLPHEAWHVVQQRQGRVSPTVQMAGVAVNDDAALENEADVMGAKAARGVTR
jgi:hypothetical protein